MSKTRSEYHFHLEDLVKGVAYFKPEYPSTNGMWICLKCEVGITWDKGIRKDHLEKCGKGHIMFLFGPKYNELEAGDYPPELENFIRENCDKYKDNIVI